MRAARPSLPPPDDPAMRWAVGHLEQHAEDQIRRVRAWVLWVLGGGLLLLIAFILALTFHVQRHSEVLRTVREMAEINRGWIRLISSRQEERIQRDRRIEQRIDRLSAEVSRVKAKGRR